MPKPTIPPGTLILWKKKYLRTVVSSSPGYVKFPIRHRSWTNRVYTVYTIDELKNMECEILAKTTRLPLLKSELELLKGAKFDPRKELARELTEAKETAKRLGRPLCHGWKRLKKLVA